MVCRCVVNAGKVRFFCARMGNETVEVTCCAKICRLSMYFLCGPTRTFGNNVKRCTRTSSNCGGGSAGLFQLVEFFA